MQGGISQVGSVRGNNKTSSSSLFMVEKIIGKVDLQNGQDVLPQNVHTNKQSCKNSLPQIRS